jgi:valyl-tRNA synthetase
MFVAMEDLMTRHARMKGIPALWVPGSDHAGIATQLQVEKHLLRTLEMTREEIGREKFLEHTWEWKSKYGDLITSQIRRLGASCDWSRERFTLDEGLSRACARPFVRLFEKGSSTVGRADQLVAGLENGRLGPRGGIRRGNGQTVLFQIHARRHRRIPPVATTRPETILGDTAVATP